MMLTRSCTVPGTSVGGLNHTSSGQNAMGKSLFRTRSRTPRGPETKRKAVRLCGVLGKGSSEFTSMRVVRRR